MSIWKDLLLHRGYVATPLALRVVSPELLDPMPGAAAPAALEPACEPRPMPWARATLNNLLLR